MLAHPCSGADLFLIIAGQHRKVKFIIDRNVYNDRKLKFWAKLFLAVPFSIDDSSNRKLQTINRAAQAIENGKAVCLISCRDEHGRECFEKFREVLNNVLPEKRYKIQPICIKTQKTGRLERFNKIESYIPVGFREPVSINFAEPLDNSASNFQIRQSLAELLSDAYVALKPYSRPLTEYFVYQARKNWKKICLSDSVGSIVDYGKALTGALILAGKFKKLEGKNVGIMVPPSVGGALANLGVTLAGKVSVNLNYVVGQEIREKCISQASIKKIITSRVFLEKIGLPLDDSRWVFLEDINKSIGKFTKFKNWMKAKFCPRQIVARSWFYKPDSLKTIIFSSGSDGTPKGVMLSHFNIVSNIQMAEKIFTITEDDCVAGILPFFHSFGYTGTIWLPMTIGAAAHYMPNPLDSSTVARGVRKSSSTILLATPTFLLSYIRRIDAKDFASLRSVVVGAEKLMPKIADAFKKKFDVTPTEGYGMTELAPFVTLNPQDDIAACRGHKDNSVGSVLPGICIKIASFDDSHVGEPDQVGRIFIKSPSLMLGYIGRPKKTFEAIRDCWYDSGDVGKLDKDGYLEITGRLSRFSKIAGEMVPHLAVEEILTKALDTHEHVVAVTSLPDEKKGEQLVVLYVSQAVNPAKLRDAVDRSSLSNIWKPRADKYFAIEEMPMLATGKLDIMKLKKLAKDSIG